MDDAVGYIRDLFLAVDRRPDRDHRPVRVCVTCALQSDDVGSLFEGHVVVLP